MNSVTITFGGFLIFLLLSGIVIFLSINYFGKNIPVLYKGIFRWGLFLKIFGALAIDFIYVFYYTYGDTLTYFSLSRLYDDFLFQHITGYSFLQKILVSGKDFSIYATNFFKVPFGYNKDAMVVIKTAGILNIFTFKSFLSTTLLFSLFSFTGLWKMFRAFSTLFPKLYKEFAVAILFIPSLVFWGSGLLKDTLSIGALGWLTWAIIHLFVLKEHKSLMQKSYYLFWLIFAAFIIYQIKIYILGAFLPGVLVWIAFNNKEKIKNKYIRGFFTPILLIVIIGIILLGFNLFSDELGAYALDNVIDTAIGLNYNLSKYDAGSSYSIGTFDGSLSSLVTTFPAAVNVALFRPYFWEVNSIVMLLSAVESFLFTFFTLYIFFKVGFFKSLSYIYGKGILAFCFLFSIIFSFAVGISSSNFGTLVRYKIPLIPFYTIGLSVLYYYATNLSIITVFLKRYKRTKTNQAPTKST